jgi:23S rRNA (pseudouridine1915-N3)-methyltransferase
MKIHVVAVGNRMPRWIEDGFAEYAGRMPRNARLSLVEVRPESRTGGKTVAQMTDAEAARIDAAVPPDSERIALDERGREFSTRDLAGWLEKKLGGGRDLAFLIGGPDGLSSRIKAGAAMQLRLSAMTLPHGLARVLLAEQLYRAASILQHHPYHRE